MVAPEPIAGYLTDSTTNIINMLWRSRSSGTGPPARLR